MANNLMVYFVKRLVSIVALLFLSALLLVADGRPKTIVVLGDSLSAGAGVDADQAWPALLQKKIDEAGLNYTVVNAGVSGNTTADGLQRVDWLLRRKTDVLILELGGNDGLRGLPIPTAKANLQTIIDRYREKYPAVKIVIAGMKMPPSMGTEYTDAFAKMYPDLATKNHATLIPFLLEDTAGKADLMQPDQIHPNPEGHKIVAQTVWQILRPLLQ